MAGGGGGGVGLIFFDGFVALTIPGGGPIDFVSDERGGGGGGGGALRDFSSF